MTPDREAIVAAARAFRALADALERLELSRPENYRSLWVNPQEAARQLGCSPDTVLRSIRAGHLAAERVSARRYRIASSELEAYQGRLGARRA